MAKAPTKKAKAKKGFEDTLWDTANQLRVPQIYQR